MFVVYERSFYTFIWREGTFLDFKVNFTRLFFIIPLNSQKRIIFYFIYEPFTGKKRLTPLIEFVKNLTA